MSFLTLSQISKKIDNNWLLKNVNFSQERFQKIAIAGETGSGKSTLLKIIAGLVQRDAGEVVFKDERVPGPEEKLLPGHSCIAYLSQHFELRNNYRVEEILSMASKMPDEKAEAIYEVCRITHLLKRRTDQLSGGEKQRIATAGLLISSPELLLLDEPYSNLDIIHRNILKSVINDIGEQLKITCILISHDPLDVLSWADEVLVMEAGCIVQKGTPQQVYRQPVSEYVAGLFGNYNLFNLAQAGLFIDLNSIKPNDKKLLLRPEDFNIGSKDEYNLRGIVLKVNFFGSYYEIEVLVEKDIIKVKTEKNNIVKGDSIYLSRVLDTGWFV
jgi:ABC-type sugar transport system ATPase subunit